MNEVLCPSYSDTYMEKNLPQSTTRTYSVTPSALRYIKCKAVFSFFPASRCFALVVSRGLRLTVSSNLCLVLRTLPYKYLLLAEFSVRTVNYGPSFFHRFMARALRAVAINRWKKTRIRNLQYGPKKRG